MRHMLRSRVGAVAIAALLATTSALAWVGPASAHESATGTQITLFVGSFGASGHLTSNKTKCIRNRVVTVFRKTSGGEEKVGQVKTDAEGGFFLDKTLPKGDYFVRVESKTLRKSGGHTHRCKGRTSDTESF